MWWGSRARMKGGTRPLHLKWGLPRVELIPCVPLQLGHGCFYLSPVLYTAGSALGILCGGVAASQVTPITLCSTSCHQSTSHLWSHLTPHCLFPDCLLGPEAWGGPTRQRVRQEYGLTDLPRQQLCAFLTIAPGLRPPVPFGRNCGSVLALRLSHSFLCLLAHLLRAPACWICCMALWLVPCPLDLPLSAGCGVATAPRVCGLHCVSLTVPPKGFSLPQGVAWW